MEILRGTIVSKGIAFGRLVFCKAKLPEVEKIISDNPEHEAKRFLRASADTLNLLQALYERALHCVGEENARIFSIQQLMLQDNDYLTTTIETIREQKVCAEYAVHTTAEEFYEFFMGMEDETMRSKSSDVIDISSHVINRLMEKSSIDLLPDIPGSIIVSNFFLPSQIITLNRSSVRGLCAVNGMRRSHAACLARNMQIPSMARTDGIDINGMNGKYAAIDGFKGQIIIEPDEDTQNALSSRMNRYGAIKGMIGKVVRRRRSMQQDSSVKLIALDLDGTIMSNAENLSEKCVEAINEADKNGITVAVCTGRMMGEIPDSVKEIEGISYFITSNGSSVINRNGNTIYSNTIETDTADKTLDILGDYSCLIDLYIDGEGYMQQSDAEKLDYYNVNDGFDSVIKSSRNMLKDIREYYNEQKPRLEKINLFFADKRERSEAIYRIGQLDPAPEIAYSMEYNLEITSSTCCKGQGLQFLSRMINADMSEVMAIGDSNNDISMLKLAGVSVAMGNAPENVRSNAAYVTDTCINDGAAKAIEKYALQRVR
ncbi:MAG: Cof-type HAD-IIB family hydrolase [Porcipelethomonas sp.]